jgi:Mrp family chromosome partitioning ATPase
MSAETRVESMQRIAEPAKVQRLAAKSAALPALHSDTESFDLENAPLRRVTLSRAALRNKPIVMPDDASAAANSYRMLRAQILRCSREQPLRAIGIVSAVDGEGKTLTAVNLALTLAADPNQTVLLVDLDLHRPSVARLLELPVSRGFDSWLAGSAGEHEICYAVEGMDRLFIVPTIAPVVGSSAELASLPTRELLAEMKEGRFNRLPNRLMIVDLPPVLLVDDFLIIAPLLDGVVLVAREGYTKREDLQRVQELLGATRLLGTVLNHSSQSEQRAY